MLVDLLIIASLGSALYRGRQIGFVRQLCSTAGFFAGLLLGTWLQPHIITWGTSAESRAALTVLSILGCALLLLTIGEYVGVYLKRRARARQWLHHLDSYFGSVLSTASLILAIWLVASIMNNASLPRAQETVRSSRLIGQINRVLPPAPAAIARLSHLINPNGFPDVFIGNEPISSAAVSLPQLGDLTAAVNKDKASVVRIKGQGCGGIVTGSGFVAGPDLIATNAHVVAGIRQPYVQDINGTHPARVVYFDPELDFAVLRAPRLAGEALPIAVSAVKSGVPAAVLGYPGGGDFKAGPAAVLSQLRAVGRDIYDSGHTVRDIYEVKANIEHGNSGGPLVDVNGTVIGVVFAESTTSNHVGYALTTPKVLNGLKQAAGQTATVSTGRCTD